MPSATFTHASARSSDGRRYIELDSMRGLAALVVVFHHFLFMWQYRDTKTVSVWTELRYPFVAGHESVILFFLLSGFVLSLPYLRGKRQRYTTFLLRRIIRIYFPYVFALALAVAGNAIWHGRLGMGAWADQTWTAPVSWRAVWQHVCMIGAYKNAMRFNTAFWSLVLEMRVSMIFPFLFLLVRRLRTTAALLTAAACSLLVHFTDRFGGSAANLMATFEIVTMFLCGILMAMHLDALVIWYRRLSVKGRVGLAIASFLLYEYSHLITESEMRGVWRLADWHVDNWPVLAGAAGLMLIGLESGPARRVLGSAVPRFLGRISYSLYLVHGTALFALAFLLHGRVSASVAFLIYLPVALIASTVFCLWIEEPFLRMGRQVGKSSLRVVRREERVAKRQAA
jgi:peptidoglycan/LPS O-acetylase OafA/YrhL